MTNVSMLNVSMPNDSMMPPSPCLSRTFSTHGEPEVEACINYVSYGGDLPTVEQIRYGVREMRAQMQHPGFRFSARASSNWTRLQRIAEENPLPPSSERAPFNSFSTYINPNSMMYYSLDDDEKSNQ